MVIDPSLENTSLVMASFVYYDRLDHSLHFLFKYHARKKIRSPFIWKFCVQFMRFVLFTNGVMSERAVLYEPVFMSNLSIIAGLSSTFKLYYVKYSLWRYRIWRQTLQCL